MQALPGSTLEVIEAKFFFQSVDEPARKSTAL